MPGSSTALCVLCMNVSVCFGAQRLLVKRQTHPFNEWMCIFHLFSKYLRCSYVLKSSLSISETSGLLEKRGFLLEICNNGTVCNSHK